MRKVLVGMVEGRIADQLGLNVLRSGLPDLVLHVQPVEVVTLELVSDLLLLLHQFRNLVGVFVDQPFAVHLVLVHSHQL